MSATGVSAAELDRLLEEVLAASAPGEAEHGGPTGVGIEGAQHLRRFGVDRDGAAGLALDRAPCGYRNGHVVAVRVVEIAGGIEIEERG